jgi:5-methylcytosine-specific restriction enzyme subunit McrC
MITIYQDYQSNLGPGWENHRTNLLSFKQLIGDQNLILQADGTLRIAHYVGFLSKGNTELQILPKIFASESNPNPSEEQQKASQLLHRLLSWSDFMNFKELSDSTVTDEEESLLEQIIRLFVHRFIQLHQRDVHRNYIHEEDELLYIRGKILFPDSFYTGLKRPGYLKNRFDELSMDNIINGIIKSTLQVMLLTSRSVTNKRLLRQAVGYLEDVSELPLSPEIFGTVIFSRMNQQYESIINLAKLIFQGKQPGFASGSQKTLSLLLPLNLLFEQTVYHMLVDAFGEAGGEVHFQEGKFWGRYIDNQNHFKLVPDFWVTKGKNVTHILDTKFKNPINSDGKIEISAGDMYQLNAYASRFQCDQLALIYPRFIGQPSLSGMEACIETYRLVNFDKEVTLRVIQIDIMKENREEIVEDLRLGIGI